jgi:hypothetical protein
MAEASEIMFSYKEVVEALVKQQGLNEGIWALSVKFGMNAANFGPNDNDLKPTAIIPVLEIGLHRMEKESNLTVDAAKVNPKQKRR